MPILRRILEMKIPHVIAGGVRHSEIARRPRVTGLSSRSNYEVKDLVKQSFRPLSNKKLSMPISITIYCYAGIP